MNFAAMLVVPALVAQAPALPTPTPGLSEQAQKINYSALTKGTVIKVAEVDGETYTVRHIEGILVLYNSKGHVLFIGQSRDANISFACGAYDGDPFPGPGQQLFFIMDGEGYAAKLVKDDNGLLIAVYNSKKHILFAMGNINVDKDGNIIAFVPRTGEMM